MTKEFKLDSITRDYLVEFGLTEREIQIYLTLLKTGPNTIMNLSRETGIKRSTTHNNVEELVNKGLISQTNYGERRLVIAESPSKLKLLVEHQKYRVGKMEENLDSVVGSINKLVPGPDKANEFEVKYYTGEAGFREVCDRSISKGTEVLFISNLDEWYKVYTFEYDRTHHVPERLKKNINLKVLAFHSKFASSLLATNVNEKRELKFLDSKNIFSSSILIYENEISIMVTSEPYNSIVITSKEVAETYRSLFMNLWEKASDK